MNGFFITATGTEIGKTFVTAGLIHQARKKGIKVRALKPVLSGFDGTPSSDTHVLLKALGQPATDEAINAISPWRMREPLSPDMAAKRENIALPYMDIVNHCRPSPKKGLTFVEGVGGAFAPLSHNHLNVDLLRDLNLPVILVAGSYLGTISHTLATLEALNARGVHVHCVVVSQSTVEPVSLQETVHALSNRTDVKILPLPRKAHWRDAEELAVLL